MKLPILLLALPLLGVLVPAAHAQDAAPIASMVAPAAMSAKQILAESRRVYAGLPSYKGTCSVVSDVVYAVGDDAPTQEVSSATARIEFVRGERLSVEGVDASGDPFKALWTPGGAYIEGAKRGGAAGEMERTDYKDDELSAVQGMVAGLTGMTGTAGSLVPAALLDNIWSNPFPGGKDQLQLLPARNLGSVPCYVVQATSPRSNSVTTYWIEQKTFLLRRMTEEQGEQRYDDMPARKGVKQPIMRLAYSLDQFVFATTEAK